MESFLKRDRKNNVKERMKEGSNKGNYKQGERQPSEWEKIIANEATDS